MPAAISKFMSRVPQPALPPLCLSPVRCPLLSDNSVFWYKGYERKTLLCSLGHFSHVLLALLLRGSDTSASFHLDWPSHHIPRPDYIASDLSLASSHQMYSVHLYSNGSKGILLKILNKEACTLIGAESFLPDS